MFSSEQLEETYISGITRVEKNSGYVYLLHSDDLKILHSTITKLFTKWLWQDPHSRSE